MIMMQRKQEIEDFLTLVSKEQLEAKFGIYLESNEENKLNIRNMPYLDIGDLPNTYNADKREAH